MGEQSQQPDRPDPREQAPDARGPATGNRGDDSAGGQGPAGGAAKPGTPLSVGRTDNPAPRPVYDSPIAQVEQAVDDAVAQVEGGLHDQITAAIKQVYDPEIPVDIYELGLIYEINIDPDNNVQVVMTLTSPNCPAAQEIPVTVRRAVGRVPQVKDVEVDIVFDPPWTPEKMSDVAKITLGMM